MTQTTRRTLLRGGAALAGTALIPAALAQIMPMPETQPPTPVQPAPAPGGLQPADGGPVAPPGAGFLQSGVRLTFAQAAGQLAIPIASLVPDSRGRWTDARSGQLIGNGSSGGGFATVDVMALSAEGILCWDTMLGLNDPPNTTTVLIDAFGAMVPGTGLTDTWLPPARLAAMPAADTAESKIVRDELETAGRKFQTLSVQTFMQGGWTQLIYDLETGLVISAGIATRMPQGTNLQLSRLVAVRTPALPGPGAAYPADVQRLTSIVYAGDYGTTVAGASAIPPAPLEVRYDVARSAPGYLLTKRTVLLNGRQVGQVDLLLPAGMVGSLWMDPAWLGQRTAGETLDSDTLTGCVTKVAGTYDGMMVVGLQTAASTVYLGYDPASGFLKAVQGADVNGPGTTTRRLNLKSAA